MSTQPEQPDNDNVLPIEFRWLGISMFVWSICLSILFHGSFLIPAFFAEIKIDADLDVEWLANLDELQGLGSAGRWAEVKLREPKPDPKPPEPETVEEKKPEPKPEKPSLKEEKPTAVPKKKLEKPVEKPTEETKTATTKFERDGPSQLPSMEAYGPGNAVFSALLRFDRIRGTELEAGTEKLIQAVPDFRIALQHTGISPVRDLDTMFMASAQPQYLEYTFLAVRHKMKVEDLQSKLDKRYENVPPWGLYRKKPRRNLVPKNEAYDDPRQIFLPSPGLAVLTRPEWLPQLTNRVDEYSPIAEGKKKRPTMIQGLEQIEQAATDSDTFALVSASRIRTKIPGVGRVTLDSMKASVQNVARPKLTIDVQFKTPKQASDFAKAFPQLKAKAIRKTPILVRGLAKMVLDRLVCSSTDRFISITGTYTPTEVNRLMNIALPFIPRPPVLTKLPPAPRASKRDTFKPESSTNNRQNDAELRQTNGTVEPTDSEDKPNESVDKMEGSGVETESR